SNSTFRLDEKYVRVKNRAALNAHHGHLSQRQLRELAEKPYDPEWMDKMGINKAVLTTFIAKQKLENLVSQGALVVEDELCFDETKHVEDEILLTFKTGFIMRASGPGKRFPDIAITSTGGEDKVFVEQDLPNCNGPSHFVRAANRLAPQMSASEARAWHTVWVRARDKYAGSLWDFRQRFAYYEMVTKGWKAAYT
ncbi:MAG: hypothetical protein Q9183_006827, partial [Haloplaca sp. 2 TL-2023]